MDFVVLGFGLGALAVLIGLGLRDLGPLLRRVRRRDELPWSEVARRVAWGRTCRAVGLLVALGGAAVCFVTLLALMLGASDGTGMTLVVLALVAALLLVAAWFLLDRQRGALGAIGRLAGTLGVNRRRPLGAGPSSRAARRPARGTGAAPRGGRAAPRDSPRPAGRPPAGSPAEVPRSEPWRRSAVDPRYREPDDDLDVDLLDPPPRRVERGR